MVQHLVGAPTLEVQTQPLTVASRLHKPHSTEEKEKEIEGKETEGFSGGLAVKNLPAMQESQV